VPADEPADPARPLDVDRDGQALAGCEPLLRPESSVPERDRHLVPGRIHDRHPLDGAGEARQRHTREPAGGICDRPGGPRQQRRDRRSHDDEDDGERRHDPDPSPHDSSIAYAHGRMAGPEAGRGAPRELSRDEIDEFLRTQRIARLGCHADGVTYVVPVIYAYDDDCGRRSHDGGPENAMLRANPRVCVEVDEYDTDGRGSWRSVIAHGTYEELSGAAIEPALSLMRERFARTAGRTAEPRPLGPGVVVLRIRLDELSGRAVER
jgi:Predicted flavin-nucleotide-binding protein